MTTETIDRLTFVEESHEYFLDGKPIPSVTTILKAVGLGTLWEHPDMDWFMRRGTLIHKACHLDNLGILDERTVAPEIKGYLKAWREFKKFWGVEVIESEQRVFNEKLWFAGQLDTLVLLGDRKEKALIDIKSGAKDYWHPYQTAGYGLTQVDGMLLKRFSVYLKEDGKYTPEPHNNLGDFQVFTAAATVFNVQKRSQA